MSEIGNLVANAISNAGRTQWASGYELSPIILTGGIASGMPAGGGGGGLPILSLTNSQNFVGGLLSNAVSSLGRLAGEGAGGGLVTSTAQNLIGPLATMFGANDVFAKYVVVPGGKLISQKIGKYPFATQQVAANAVVRQPLQISVLMICPAQQAGDYWNKQQILTKLKRSLEQHNNSGGTYTVATPGYNYTNCLMLDMTDVSDGESKQVQFKYQLDFEQPLITQQDAEQAQSALLSKLTSGARVDGDPPSWSGIATSIGSASVNSVIKASSGLAGASVAGIPPSLTQIAQVAGRFL